MRTIVLLLVPLLAFGVVVTAVSDEPSKWNTTQAPVDTAKPDKQTASSKTPQDWMIIEEEIWFCMLDEPEENMQKARESFLKKNMKAAATNLHLAAQYLRSEAMNAAPAGRRVLAASAEELNRLADQIQQGTIKSVKALDAAFARAEHALAFHHARKAAYALAENNTRKAGHYLKSATSHLEGAAAWTGRELEAGTIAVIDGARLLGRKMIDGSGFILEEAGEGISAIGREVKRFGKFIEPER